MSVALLFLWSAASTQADFVIYNQPSNFPVSPGTSGVWASMNSTGGSPLGNFATIYDNFTLPGIPGFFQISSLTWQGGYFRPGNMPTLPITAFHIDFYANDPTSSGQFFGPPSPGSLLASYLIPGTANQTFVGTEQGTTGSVLVFNYSADLPSTFVAQTNTQYWLAIYPDLNLTPPNSPTWGWHTSGAVPPGDRRSIQDFQGIRFGTPQPDMAFSLSALTQTPETIPEPASLLVWGALGVAGLAGYQLRKRKAAA
jgi:hypothetical protein